MFLVDDTIAMLGIWDPQVGTIEALTILGGIRMCIDVKICVYIYIYRYTYVGAAIDAYTYA